MSHKKLCWSLLCSKPKKEERGLNNLQNHGIEAFYPTRAVEKVRKGIRSIKSEVLFPNYLFVKLNPEQANFNENRSTSGIFGVVPFGTLYAKVADGLVKWLKELTDNATEKPVDCQLAQPGNSVVIKMAEQQCCLTLENSDFELTDK